ncbi:uncharacterized protein LOC119684417 [Teleopsis dalmanni]|uniref:uncharacterized protein LOC119684417 n=1 Tax=Teleopsis dalmanni TaxID=139649 RepID=UPI0018CD2C0C|nr:uncharacterized protein LOC119684417 [Teleopsis dalmanni]
MDKLYVESDHTDGPQKIELMSNSDTEDIEEHEFTKLTDINRKKIPNYIVPPYNVTPLMSYNDERAIELVSVNRNSTLRERWHNYLTSKRQRPAKLQLFRDTLQEMPKPRKFNLNGQFYDAMNRLCPVPFIPKVTNKVQKTAEETNGK